MTIEKFNKRKDKKTYDEKNVHKNYFIHVGISYKPDDFFSKTISTFYPKTIKIFAKNNKNEDYNKYHKIRIYAKS